MLSRRRFLKFVPTILAVALGLVVVPKWHQGSMFNTDEVICLDGVCSGAFWTALLTDAELKALHDGVSPLLIRPESLVAYWPLIPDVSN